MTPFEKVLQSAKNGDKKDRLLVAYLEKVGVLELCQAIRGNGIRGDIFEITQSKTKVYRTGLHTASDGDFTNENGERIEVKYCTPKTGANYNAKGMTASRYRIGFNDGKALEIREIEPSEIIAKDGRIPYKGNATKGILIETFTL